MDQITDFVIDLAGNAVPGALVRVLNASQASAAIYDAQGRSIPNPITTDQRGGFSFAAPNGKYYLQYTVNNQVTATDGPRLLYDPADDTGLTGVVSTLPGVVARVEDAETSIEALTLGASGVSWDAAVFPLYAAHRGMEMAFPENTLLAFQEAVKAGAGAVEMDCYMMADGNLVVMHDATTTRTCRLPDGTSITQNIESLTAQDVYGLDASYRVNSNEYGFFGSDFEFNAPPLLQEVLATLKGKAILMIEAKGSNSAKGLACAQAVADLVDKLKMQASVVIQSAQNLPAAGVNLRGSKWGYITTATQQSAAMLDTLRANSCHMIIMDKSGLDAPYKTLVNGRGIKVTAYTYARPDEIGVMPDVVLAVDTTIVAGKRLVGSRDYLMRKYAGPGYTREGFGGSPSTNRSVPVIRTIANRRAIGFPSASASAGSTSRTVICAIDPDPNNDGQYTLDFDVIWTAFDPTMTNFCFVSVELDKAGTLAENAATSITKRGYSIGFRASGGANIYRLSGDTPTSTSIASATGLPNPPVLNQPYPCRIVVNSTSIVATFDVGGLNIVMTANDTTHRNGKYIQLERRGHGFMIANLRAS